MSINNKQPTLFSEDDKPKITGNIHYEESFYSVSQFSQQLTNLTNKVLTIKDQDILKQVIDYLLVQLELGHSCAKLTLLIKALNIAKNDILKILLNSNLVAQLNLQGSLQISDIKLEIKPLYMVNVSEEETLLYVTRYLNYELQISKCLTRLIQPTSIDNSFINNAQDYLYNLAKKGRNLPNEEQTLAILNSLTQKFSIISGGPGTGKTTTIILLLATLYKYYGNNLKINLCAPTGKASARVKESLQNSLDMFNKNNIAIETDNIKQLLNNSNSFSTIHKLLGTITNHIYFKHNATNHLNVEVLIIDESSMIGLPLFAKLITAINPLVAKHIILLGDKNQLSSVEEGYVFASLINNFINLKPPIVTQLYQSKRSSKAIATLANQILKNETDLIIQTLTNNSEIILRPCTLNNIIHDACHSSFGYNPYVEFIQNNQSPVINQEYIKNLFNHYNKFTMLCLSNSGTFGTDNLNYHIEKYFKLKLGVNNMWYIGRPVLITENDHTLNLYNGDIGICQIVEGKAFIVFNNGRRYIPEMLPSYKLAYAITIHKSQGSEFEGVAVILKPDSDNVSLQDNLLVKELIYTAITRAKSKVTIYSGKNKLQTALKNNTIRHSGLEFFLK